MALRGRGNDDVTESRRMALAACPVRQDTGDTLYGSIERQDTVAIEMQDMEDSYKVFAVVDASGTYSKMAQEFTLAP